jgi:hypothetical protein
LPTCQLVCLKDLAEWLTGRRLADYQTNLANLRLFVEDPSLRADRRRSVLTREAFETAELLDGAYVACDRRYSWLPLVCRGAGLAPTPFRCWQETRGRIWASSRARGDLEQGSHAGGFSGTSRPEPPWSHFQAPLVASRFRGPGRQPRPKDPDRPERSAHARISVRPQSE